MDRSLATALLLLSLSTIKIAALAFLGWIIWRADDAELPPADSGDGGPPPPSRYLPPSPSGGAWRRASRRSRERSLAGRS